MNKILYICNKNRTVFKAVYEIIPFGSSLVYLSKNKTLNTTFLVCFYPTWTKKNVSYRNVYNCYHRSDHIRDIEYLERLLTHILKGKMNLLWKK